MTDEVVALEESVDDLLTGDRADGEWRRVVPGDTAEQLQSALVDAEEAFVRLRLILRRRFREQAAKERNLTVPEYAVLCANAAGYKQALQDVFKLISQTTLKTTETPK